MSASRCLRSVSPRLAASAFLVSLVGPVLVSVSAAVCTGWLAVSAALRVPVVGGCSGADCSWGWAGVACAVAAAGLVPLIWRGAGVLAVARRAVPDVAVMAFAESRHPVGGGTVWVLPAAEPAAWTCGLLRPRAVVTSGLLELLDPREQQAVIEHEGAHIRLGHPGLLVLAAAVARAYGFLPPVRAAWSGLRRELEAAADDEAVKVTGVVPLISALATVALARRPVGRAAPVMGFAEHEHLRYRLARLQYPCPRSSVASGLVLAAGCALGVAFAGLSCLLAYRGAAGTGMVACVTAMAVTGLCPLLPSRSRGSGVQKT